MMLDASTVEPFPISMLDVVWVFGAESSITAAKSLENNATSPTRNACVADLELALDTFDTALNAYTFS